MGGSILMLFAALSSCRNVQSFVMDPRPRYFRNLRAIRFSSSNGHAANDIYDDVSLLDLLVPSADCKVDQMSSTDLAYIGDAVYELLVRSRSVWPSKKTSHLQEQVVGLVRAEHQSLLLGKLRQHFDLTTAEQQVLSRGRNASTGSSKNRRNPSAYQDSTALEALVGYLFLTDRRRCHELLSWIHANLHDSSNNNDDTTTN